MDFSECFDFQFFILGDHDLLESEEIVTEEDLSEDLVVTLALDTLNDALFQSFLRNADFLDHAFEQQSGKPCEFLEDLGVFELIFLLIFKKEAVFFNKVEEGIAPDGGGEVLPHVVIHPVLIFAELIFLRLFLFFLLRSEQPLQHKIFL